MSRPEFTVQQVNVHEDFSHPRATIDTESGLILRYEPRLTITIVWQDGSETVALNGLYGDGRSLAKLVTAAVVLGCDRKTGRA